MKSTAYLIIGKNGIRTARKSKPNLKWDEIAIRISFDVPDILFQRPHIEATITIDKDKVQPEQITPDIIINTKELIEQQTGAKIDFKIIEIEKEKQEV